MNVMAERNGENEMVNYLAELKVQSDCLTDEDWEILGVGPAVAYKSGWHEGFFEALKLFGRRNE